MKKVFSSGLFVVITLLAFSLTLGRAQAQTYRHGGDVEYNVDAKSPTLPLVQHPPPENSPNSVYVGQPNYYYYYPTGGYGYGSYYNTPQAGAVFSNVGGQNRRTFWVTTPIPGQVAPMGGAPGFGQGFYGPGFFPSGGNGNSVFIP